MTQPNIDPRTVAGFGYEWTVFDQESVDPGELADWFGRYFSVFPWGGLPRDAVGFDAGCGTGRWAAFVSGRVGHLHCIDASPAALAVARRRLAGHPNCSFHEAGVDRMPLEDGSMDFGYSLGVLHHLPDTAAALRDCARKLKPGAPLLVYLYYAFDNRPRWFRAVWRVSDLARRGVSRLPRPLALAVSTVLAATAYWPLARFSRWAQRRGRDVGGIPLSAYRNSSFYVMRNDALDRFGTRLERRFTRQQIAALMEQAGLRDVRFRDGEPYWCAVGTKR